MSTETVTVKINKSIGYSGIKSGKSYIAQISGTDDTYIFTREFIDTEATDRAEMFRCRRKRKGTWVEAAALPVGLYEISEHGERRYIVVWHKTSGTPPLGIVKTNISDDRATKMAILMDGGKTCEEAREATKPPKKDSPAVAS